MPTQQPFSIYDYHNDPRRRAKSAFIRLSSKMLRRLGFDLELAHFYSPIPHADDRPVDWWLSRTDLPGVSLDLSAQLRFIEAELASHIAEFQPPRDSGGPLLFYLANGLFQGGDADLLYAMIRRFKPSRMLELGAGFSTLVAAMAVTANRNDGWSTELTTCDPYATPPVPESVPGLTQLRPESAQDLEFSEFTTLGPDDILFIDSSHTVKIGGDVVHLVTEVLPRLAPGVIVHVHDVYLPWHYPREWISRNHWYWAEQYLLQALLCENERWEVMIAAYALSRDRGEEAARLIPNLVGAAPPLSFWIRRRP